MSNKSLKLLYNIEPNEDGTLKSLWEIEKDYILKVLKITKGNKTKAANILGITIKTLYSKIESY